MPTEMKSEKKVADFLLTIGMVRIDDIFEEILISAERYSLGRMTYVVPDYVQYVIPLVPYLSDKTLDILLRDLIDRSMQEGLGDGEFSPWGMEQDREEWKKLWDTIEDEQKRRVAEV